MRTQMIGKSGKESESVAVYAMQLVVFCCIAATKLTQNGDTTNSIVCCDVAKELSEITKSRSDGHLLFAYGSFYFRFFC